MLHLTTNQDDPYGPRIQMYLSKILGGANLNNFKQLLHELTEALYANKDIRFGPMPDPEAIVTVRSIAKKYVDEERPIPILVPWGSIKARFGEIVDIAEVSAIDQLIALSERVSKIYKPGLDIVIRVEDTSGYHLYCMDLDYTTLHTGTQTYIQGFRKLVNLIDKTRTIHPIFESEMRHATSFNRQAEENLPYFLKYLEITDNILVNEPSDVVGYPDFQALKAIGWQGVIPTAQRDHYYKTYERLYNLNHHEARIRLANYMAEALARRQLDMSGRREDWNNGFIQVTFVPPVAGLPHGFDNNFIYYRTIPENCGRTHMSPWRGKGYLRISDTAAGLSITPKLTAFNDAKDYYPLVSTLKGPDGTEVDIKTDYILE